MDLRSRLGSEGVEPIAAPDLSRRVELFTACTQKSVKVIQKSKWDTTCRNCHYCVWHGAYVRRNIHWGPSNDVEGYIQETGRAGRDGKFAEALLYTISRPGNQFVDDAYTKNKEIEICRR